MEFAVRYWKRDQTFNVMSLEAAVENLFVFMQVSNGCYLSKEDIKDCLRGGDLLETRHAVFTILEEQGSGQEESQDPVQGLSVSHS